MPRHIRTIAIGMPFVLFALNVIAMEVYWYQSIWWFDVAMHTVGGVWLVYLLVWFGRRYGLMRDWRQAVWVVLTSIVIITGLWEIFELSIESILSLRTLTNPLDTASDMLVAFGGACLTLVYLERTYPYVFR